MKPKFPMPKFNLKSRCAKCGLELKAGELLVLADNKNYHSKCFEQVTGIKVQTPKWHKKNKFKEVKA